MSQLKILSYASYANRSHFLPHGLRVKLGGTNLHQMKLILPALHLATFAAQRCQPFAHRPVVTHTAPPDMPACQLTVASLLLVKISVCARGATFFNHDAILVRHHRCFITSLHVITYLHPTSYIPHPTSHILHPTSYIPHPTSHILHHPSCVSISKSSCPFDTAKLILLFDPAMAFFRRVQACVQDDRNRPDYRPTSRMKRLKALEKRNTTFLLLRSSLASTGSSYTQLGNSPLVCVQIFDMEFLLGALLTFSSFR